MTYKELDTFLKEDLSHTIEDKRFLFGLFGSLRLKDSQEKINQGFRYFHCTSSQLTESLANLNIDKITELPYALDEEGDIDTSSVCLQISYTDSGSFVAFQVQEYINYNPTAISEVKVLEATQGQQIISKLKQLDQSN